MNFKLTNGQLIFYVLHKQSTLLEICDTNRKNCPKICEILVTMTMHKKCFLVCVLASYIGALSCHCFELKPCSEVLTGSRPVLCSSELDYRKNDQPPDRPLHIQGPILQKN